MAEASKCVLGYRDFQMMYVKKLSSTICWGGRISGNGSVTKVKACCSNNGGHGASQIVRVSGEVVNVGNHRENSLNGTINGSSPSSARFWDRSSIGKIVIAVDIDEVLGNFISALNQFISDRYSQSHSVSEYYVYEFFKIWNCSPAEADIRVHEFFKTAYFKKGIYPIPGAREALNKLSERYSLSIVTSRQNAIKDHTVSWIEKHYPGLFQDIHFGNHFALDGASRPKSEICRSLGAKILIDDNPRYAAECADIGMKVLLFDYENSYPWCKTNEVARHPLVTKVRNWKEVELELVSWVVHQ